jgi:hypothetical protein
LLSAEASARSRFFSFYLVPLLVGRAVVVFGFVSGQSLLQPSFLSVTHAEVHSPSFLSFGVAREQEACLARSPPSTHEIELFGSCVLNHWWVFLVLLPIQLIQLARGGSWVVGRVRRVREQRGEL